MRWSLLLTEADEGLREVYQRFLTRNGYAVETASEGLECLTKLRHRAPDVLVLDLEVLWGGGEGVLAWLREEGRGLGVPVVLTATAASAPLFDHLTVPPVVRSLLKPFPLAALLDSIRTATQGDRPLLGDGCPHPASPGRCL